MMECDVGETGQGVMSTEMEELGIGGDAYREVMAILMIPLLLAGLQPVIWKKGDFSTSPPAPLAERGEMNWVLSSSHREFKSGPSHRERL